ERISIQILVEVLGMDAPSHVLEVTVYAHCVGFGILKAYSSVVLTIRESISSTDGRSRVLGPLNVAFLKRIQLAHHVPTQVHYTSVVRVNARTITPFAVALAVKHRSCKGQLTVKQISRSAHALLIPKI